MHLALQRPELLNRLVVVDISPVNYKDSFKKFSDFIEDMKSMNLKEIKSRKHADDVLAESVSVRNFDENSSYVRKILGKF